MPDIAPLDHKAVRKGLSQKEKLPTLPTTYTELVRVMGDPSSTVVELSEIIMHDPSITANVLRVANSAFMGNQEKIEDISKAVFILGQKEIGDIALSVGYFDVFASKAKGISEDFLKNIWTHSAATAMIGNKIAQVGCFDFVKDAYLCGLMHDVGKLFFASTYTSTYAEIRSAVAAGADGLDLEKKVFGVTHLEVANELCKHWKMPDTVRHSAVHHHDPTKPPAEFQPLVFCIGAANVIAHELVKDEPIDNRLEYGHSLLTGLAGTSTNAEFLTFDSLLPQFNHEVEKAKMVMSATKKRRPTI